LALDPNAKIALGDPVPEITRKHFDWAWNHARRSVTTGDLQKFEEFRKKFDPVFASQVSTSNTRKLNWPGAG